MRLYAISDLHLAQTPNRTALRALARHPEDWLIVAGDVCESSALFAEAMEALAARFAQVLWTPGNHELWLGNAADRAAGSPAKYAALVALARKAGVLTPEDPYPVWPDGTVLAPLFTSFDYSFRPAGLPRASVAAWAAERHCLSRDERLIRPAPFADMESWCAALCARAEERLAAAIGPQGRSVLISHYPLRQDLVHIPRIPRFTPWCGSTATEAWPARFNASVAVSGHLHMRRTLWHDGTRFEEVSLGYARQWEHARGLAAYLRDVTPPPAARPPDGDRRPDPSPPRC